jgi:hypothetical protein
MIIPVSTQQVKPELIRHGAAVLDLKISGVETL